jgi:electron transfer flavoprotein alpha subunit
MNQDTYVVIEHLQGQIAEMSYITVAAARVLAQGTGGDVVAVLLGKDVQRLSDNLAVDRVLNFDHPLLADFTSDAYQQVLAEVIGDHMPRAVLLGHTSVGMDVAGGLSVQLNLPLVSQCRAVSAGNGTLKFTCQICGGKLMAEGELPDTTTLLTMIPGGFKPEEGQSTQPPEITPLEVPTLENLRVTLKEYIEPDASDVDIAKEPVLIAVGRGLQDEDDLELAEDLADALGGTICASRPVVDKGWLPITRQVGKSGKRVKPRLYLALGISGAPEHVEAITDSEVIIAVNTDPAAPIFDIAQYGVEADMFDLLEVLPDQIREARSRRN